MTRIAVENLFPTPVVYYQWSETISNRELEFVKSLPQRSNQGNTTSADSFLFKRKELKRIKNFAEECINDFCSAVISPSRACQLHVTQAWANYTKLSQYHHKHHHPNSIISGVFYVNAEKDKDRIKFFNELHERSPIKVATENFNLYNSESWWLPVTTNQLILFPSRLHHMVDTVEGDHERISIAFNTFWSGDLGSVEELTHLTLP